MKKKPNTALNGTPAELRLSLKDAFVQSGLAVKSGVRAGAQAGAAGTASVQSAMGTEETRT